MKSDSKLMKQIGKFGIVGVVCFLIDFIVYTILNYVFVSTGMSSQIDQAVNSVIGSADKTYYAGLSKLVSTVVSMIVNYILSMKYVFTRKDNISRRREFLIFVILSVIGLAIAEIILYAGKNIIDPAWPWLVSIFAWFGKITGRTKEFFEDTFWMLGSTAIVMCYNFISRKLTLEKKVPAEELPAEEES